MYRAECVKEPSKKVVALKYPASPVELEALQAIKERDPSCLGVKPLLSSGTFAGKPYLATEVLGPSLAQVFEKLGACEEELRWEVVRLVGRMLLRRLEAIHRCGVVHGDVAPLNILLGEAACGGTGVFFVDFGSAQPFPGGEPVMPFWSTVEFNSVFVVDGAVRGPRDDLESLGYVLCHGLYGELPWFNLLQAGPWEGKSRDEACERAREAKTQLLYGTWAALGLEWTHFMHMPKELGKFLRACACRKDGEDSSPDYAALASLLGGGEGAGETEDCALLREVLQHLKLQHLLPRRPATISLPKAYAHLAKEVVPRGVNGPSRPLEASRW